jgi:hypothetical protein
VFSTIRGRAHRKFFCLQVHSESVASQFLTLAEHICVCRYNGTVWKRSSSGSAVIRHRVPCLHHGAHHLHGMLQLLRSCLAGFSSACANGPKFSLGQNRDRTESTYEFAAANWFIASVRLPLTWLAAAAFFFPPFAIASRALLAFLT